MGSNKALLPIYLVVFFGFVGYALMITVFTPLVLHSQATHTTVMLGLLLCAYPLGQFLGSPVAGALSDHFGRKYVLQVTLGLTALMYIFIGLAIIHFRLLLLAGLCFVTGIFESNVALAVSAVADYSEAHNRTRLFGYINLAASSAYIAGPLLGGPLSNHLLVSWFNFATPFWIVGALLAGSIVLIQWLYHDKRKPQPNTPINYLQAMSNVVNIIRPSRFRRIFLLNFLLYTALYGFFRSYPMYVVSHYQLGINQESHYIAWVSVPLIVANLGIIAWLAKKLSAKTMMAMTACITGLGMILIVIPSSIHALWFTLFFAGAGIALCLPAVSSYISFKASSAEQGAVMGNNNAVSVAAEAFSGLLGGMLAAIAVKLSLIVLGTAAIIMGCITFYLPD